MPESDPIFWPIRKLTSAFSKGVLSPAELTEDVLHRIDHLDGDLSAYVTPTPDLARSQAAAATERYRAGDSAPLLGVPVSIKDAFHVADVETTLGSLVHRGQIARSDSGVVERLRGAGAVFPGKTNIAEFCQSATSDNLLGPETGNPWDLSRTPGGSSGGAAASVGAGLATAAVGSDGGGSIRIPAAFCGLVGIKPTTGSCADERGFRAMTDFVTPGPLTWTVDDARIILEVLAETRFQRSAPEQGLRIGFCPAPEGRPVHAEITQCLTDTAAVLSAMGHRVEECSIPLTGWDEIFGPLVLDDENRERGHLLARPGLLTRYELASLRGARNLTGADVSRSRNELGAYRRRMADFLNEYDVLLTPTVAAPAFPHGRRPKTIEGTEVDWLWGAFPFTVPFNVGGVPAITLPVGLADGMPIGAQFIAARGRDEELMNLAEAVEAEIAFDHRPLRERWTHGLPNRSAQELLETPS